LHSSARRATVLNMLTVSEFEGGTLFYQEFPALGLVDASEARFLTSAMRDAVREARARGRSDAAFHVYRVRAWREALGSRLVTVTWRVTRAEQPVAGDTYILPNP
jgi:hypothetical protein